MFFRVHGLTPRGYIIPPPAEAEEEGKNAKDKIMERLRRDNYYCGRDARVPKGRQEAGDILCGRDGRVPGGPMIPFQLTVSS